MMLSIIGQATGPCYKSSHCLQNSNLVMPNTLWGHQRFQAYWRLIFYQKRQVNKQFQATVKSNDVNYLNEMHLSRHYFSFNPHFHNPTPHRIFFFYFPGIITLYKFIFRQFWLGHFNQCIACLCKLDPQTTSYLMTVVFPIPSIIQPSVVVFKMASVHSTCLVCVYFIFLHIGTCQQILKMPKL